MKYVPKPIRNYFFLAALASFSLYSKPTAMQPGRLVILLHETGSLGSESQTKKEIGAVTMRAATAIAEQAGIIVMSPTIWCNLLARIDWFGTQITKQGSIASLFNTAWQLNARQQSVQTHTQLQALSSMDPTLLHHLYLFQHQPTSGDWLCYSHTEASLIILIPKKYLEMRQSLLPRSLPTTYQPDEYATGMRLATCNPISLPPKATGWQRLATHAHHLRKRSTFSLAGLESLFIPHQSIHPLLTIHWNIYMVGHGTYKNTICGLTTDQFSNFLHWCSTQLMINCFYYQSCYGGGHSLFELSGAKRNFTFPLVAGAIGEAPVHALMPRQGTTTIAVDINITQFFEALEHGQLSWAGILSPITPVVALPQDMHAMSNTPLVLLPGESKPTPIDVNNHKTSTGPSSAHIIRAGIVVFSTNDELAYLTNPQPFVVRGKRAILLTPKEIARPLEIHPYQKINRKPPQQATTFIAPALLSLSPGNALHHCAALTAHDIDLKSFLTKSFMQLTKQQSSKIFLFDSLTLTNDLSTNFTSEKASFWDTITTTARRWIYGESTALETPQIALNKVLVMINAQRLTCIFLEPCSNNETRARKVVYNRQQGAQQNEPQSLDIQTISLYKHAALYKKYSLLCKKQQAH